MTVVSVRMLLVKSQCRRTEDEALHNKAPSEEQPRLRSSIYRRQSRRAVAFYIVIGRCDIPTWIRIILLLVSGIDFLGCIDGRGMHLFVVNM